MNIKPVFFLAAALACGSAWAQTAATSALSAADAQFLQEAAAAGLAEVDMGHMAAERAGRTEVKSFGQRMVDDHNQANAELATLASRKGVTLPAETPAAAHTDMQSLSNMSGADFDKSYTKMMVSEHQKAVALFQRASESSTDPEIKAWASKVLPTLKAHLSTVKRLAPNY